MTTFDIAAFLLVLAAFIGLVNQRWLGLPHNIALLIGAILAAVLVIVVDGAFVQGRSAAYWRERIHHANLEGVLLNGVLALLLFAGSIHVDIRELRDRAWPVALLATGGVVIATVVFGAGFYWLALGLGYTVPLIWCLILGAILAPTDAVVVEGLLRRVRMPAALRATISGESLFNDGAAVVLLLAGLAFAAGHPDVVGHGRLTVHIAQEVLGGALIGWLGGFVAAWMSRGVSERSLELTISLALALGSYRLAAEVGVSGPIAVVAAGLAFRRGLPPKHGGADPSRAQLTSSWAVIDDLLNTYLFLLMGFQILAINVSGDMLAILPLAFLIAVLARAVSVCIPMLLLRLPPRERVRGVVVLTWTGLRGGISIALALALPATPYRDLLLAVGYGVVIATIILQGLTVPAMLRLLYRKAPEAERER